MNRIHPFVAIVGVVLIVVVAILVVMGGAPTRDHTKYTERM